MAVFAREYYSQSNDLSKRMLDYTIYFIDAVLHLLNDSLLQPDTGHMNLDLDSTPFPSRRRARANDRTKLRSLRSCLGSRS